MITLRRNTERHHAQHGKGDIWAMFQRQKGPRPADDEFGLLTNFEEILLPPGGTAGLHEPQEAEMVTYVHRGALTQSDSTGRSGVVHTGEFQRMIIGRGVRYAERNASRTVWTHLFRVFLSPFEAGLDNAHEQRLFAVAQRHNLLCVIASPDGRKGSLRVLQDAIIYSSILDTGHHLVVELLPGRSAWLQIISGEAALQDIILTQGDGAGVAMEPKASFTANEQTEILLVDLGPAPRSFASGARDAPK